MARDRDEVDQIVDGMRETGGSGREERQAQRTIVAHMLMRVDVEQQLGTMITNLYPRLAQRARCPASGRLEQRLRRDWRLDPIGRGSRHDPIGRSSSSAHHLHSLTPAPTCHNTLLVTDPLAGDRIILGDGGPCRHSAARVYTCTRTRTAAPVAKWLASRKFALNSSAEGSAAASPV